MSSAAAHETFEALPVLDLAVAPLMWVIAILQSFSKILQFMSTSKCGPYTYSLGHQLCMYTYGYTCGMWICTYMNMYTNAHTYIYNAIAHTEHTHTSESVPTLQPQKSWRVDIVILLGWPEKAEQVPRVFLSFMKIYEMTGSNFTWASFTSGILQLWEMKLPLVSNRQWDVFCIT